MVLDKTFYVQGVADALLELGHVEVTLNQIKQINAYLKGVITFKPEETKDNVEYLHLIEKITEILKLEDHFDPRDISEVFLKHQVAIQEQHDNNYALYRAGSWGEFLMPMEGVHWQRKIVQDLKKLVLEKRDLEAFLKSTPEDLREKLSDHIGNAEDFFKLKQLLIQDMNRDELEVERQTTKTLLKDTEIFLKKAVKEQQTLKVPQFAAVQLTGPWMNQNRLHLIGYFEKNLKKLAHEQQKLDKPYAILDAKIKSFAIPLYRDKETKEQFKVLKEDLLKQHSQLIEIEENYLQQKKNITNYLAILYESSQKIPVNFKRTSIEGFDEKKVFSEEETQVGSPPSEKAFSLIDGPKLGKAWEFKVDCMEPTQTKPVFGRFSYDPQGYRSFSKLIDRSPVRFNHGIFRVTQFPTGSGLDSESMKQAICIFSLTLVAQALATRTSFPSAKIPLLIKGNKAHEVRALYAAAQALGVKPEAIHVISPYNPKADKTWYGAKISVFKSVFLKNPQLIEEFRAVAKITPEQEQFKKGVHEFKKQLLKEQKNKDNEERQQPPFPSPGGS